MERVFKTKAWLTEYSYVGPQDLFNPEYQGGGITYSSQEMQSQGWTEIGDAEITVRLLDQQTMTDNKVAALREELKTVRAEAHKKAVEIEDKIAKLLAITYEPSDGAA
jgi:hypothetical protein